MHAVLLIFCWCVCWIVSPSDIFKFLVATMFPTASRLETPYLLVALLYFWSGLYKVRGYFWSWVFQYQFLLMSPVSYPLRRFYLNEDLTPRTWSKVFGVIGAAGECLVGLGLLFPDPTVQFVSTIFATKMHIFIFTFGMGPYRWNVMQ
eukprot:gene10722-12684_t